MAEAEAPASDLREELQGLRRTNRLLLCLMVLCLAVALLQRVGSRVYALAVLDRTLNRYVEVTYLAQRQQAEAVLRTLLQQARDKHPVYREHPDVFERANARFRDPVLIHRVRRQVRLAGDQAGAAPVQEAVRALQPVVQVVVDGYGITAETSTQPLVVLASDAWALQALNTRLENVSVKVEAQLAGVGLLTERPEFVPAVTTRLVPGWPIDQVKTVAQAVDFLTHGDLRNALHTVKAGEPSRLTRIAEQYHCTVADLERWNEGSDLSLLKVGDTLIVRKPEPPLTVKTVEHRYPVQRAELNGRMRPVKLTIEVVRHDGVEVHRTEISREPAG